VGLGLAFLGVLLSVLTGDGRWDGAGSVAVGVLLACAAFVVGYETKSLLIGEAATAEVSAAIVGALEAGEPGFRVIHMRTSHIGPEDLLVAAKIAVPAASMTAGELAAAIDAAELRVRTVVPIARTIYLEPDVYRPGQADPADPAVAIVDRSSRRRSRTSRHPDGTSQPT
jgi:divalent metal cation (Fe/Co/Zn/Cd) transporter